MNQNNNPDLSVIILSYKSKEHLKALLPSLMASEGVCFGGMPPHPNPLPPGERGTYYGEIIVVDNDSGDGTAEFVESWTKNHLSDLSAPARHLPSPGEKGVVLFRNINNGFAAGNNIGIRQSHGKYILLLNPDTTVEPDTLKTMVEFMESRPDVGISGCKIVKPDGSLDLACRRRFPNPWNSFARLFLRNNKNYNYSDISIDQEMEVDSVVGAFLLIRRSVMDKIGLLDEAFFMYGEDLDWCWRCKEAGYNVWYYPKTSVVHYKGESSKKAPFKMLKVFYDAMWIFYRKHYKDRYPFFFNWIVWLGIYGRLTALLVFNAFKKNPVVSR